MFDHVEIGHRIESRRKELDLTLTDVAQEVGVAASTIQRYEKGYFDRIKMPVIEAIADALHVNPDWLICNTDDPVDYEDGDLLAPVPTSYIELFDGDVGAAYRYMEAVNEENSGKLDLEDFKKGPTETPSVIKKRVYSIPVLGKVQAGIPMDAVEYIIDYEEISEEKHQFDEYFALQVKGDSMEPKISGGDVVIVLKQPDAESGDIVVALVNGNEATIKKLQKFDGGINLVPNNPAYDVLTYTNEQIRELPVEIIGKVIELRAKF